MAWKRWMMAATGACAFAMMVGGAQSAPFGRATPEVGSPAVAGTGFERVVYRRAYRYRARGAYGYRAYGYAAPRAYGYRGRVSRYAAPRAYGYRVGPALGYGAPPVLDYSAAPVSGDVAHPAYVDSVVPVLAPPVPAYGYVAAPPAAYGYAAAPPAVYGAGPPVVRRLVPAIEYDDPYVYPVGTPAWWSVMNRENRGGQPQ